MGLEEEGLIHRIDGHCRYDEYAATKVAEEAERKQGVPIDDSEIRYILFEIICIVERLKLLLVGRVMQW